MTTLNYQPFTKKRNSRAFVRWPASLFIIGASCLASTVWSGHQFLSIVDQPPLTGLVCGNAVLERNQAEYQSFTIAVFSAAAAAISTLCGIRLYNSRY